MGPGLSGGIASHLAKTKEAVLRWLEYEQPTRPKAQAAGSLDSLLLIATEDTTNETPEQPEVLALLRESRRFGVPVFPGALTEWPWLSKQELNVAIDAENEHEKLLAVNVAMQAKHNAQVH